jgi:hypothetical protein
MTPYQSKACKFCTARFSNRTVYSFTLQTQTKLRLTQHGAVRILLPMWTEIKGIIKWRTMKKMRALYNLGIFWSFQFLAGACRLWTQVSRQTAGEPGLLWPTD